MKKILIILSVGIIAFSMVGCGFVGAESTDTIPEEKIKAEEKAKEAEEEKDITETPLEEVDSAETALEIGDVFFDRSQNEKAIAAYKKATKLDPELAEAHFQLGVAYAIKESEEEMIAAPVVEETNDSDKKKKDDKPKKPNSEIAFENAVTAYKKLVREDKKNAEAFYNLGRAYNKLSEDKDAKKALEKAVKLEPENSAYQTEYGEILIKFAKYDLAIRALNKALNIDSANSQAASLLKKAKAGKKRVDFGAEKLKQRAAK